MATWFLSVMGTAEEIDRHRRDKCNYADTQSCYKANGSVREGGVYNSNSMRRHSIVSGAGANFSMFVWSCRGEHFTCRRL